MGEQKIFSENVVGPAGWAGDVGWDRRRISSLTSHHTHKLILVEWQTKMLRLKQCFHKKTGEYVHNLRIGKGFLASTQKVLIITGRNNKIN